MIDQTKPAEGQEKPTAFTPADHQASEWVASELVREMGGTVEGWMPAAQLAIERVKRVYLPERTLADTGLREKLRAALGYIRPKMIKVSDGASIQGLGMDGVDEAIDRILCLIPARAEGWRAISEAKKDGTIYWSKLRDDIFPVLKPKREDLKRWNGVQIPILHNGICEDGFDIGWQVAAPVGAGGFPDDWFEGFMSLPFSQRA